MVDLTCARCSKSFTEPRRGAKRCKPCRVLDARERAARQHEKRRGDADYEAYRRAAQERYRSKVGADPESKARRSETLAAWRTRNAQHVADYERRYRRANAARVAEKNRRRRARLLDAWVEDVDISIVYERDGGACGICSDPIDPTLDWPERMSLTLDHIVPLARGGEHSYANAQVAHAACNARKNDRLAA